MVKYKTAGQRGADIFIRVILWTAIAFVVYLVVFTIMAVA